MGTGVSVWVAVGVAVGEGVAVEATSTSVAGARKATIVGVPGACSGEFTADDRGVLVGVGVYSGDQREQPVDESATPIAPATHNAKPMRTIVFSDPTR